MFSQKQKTALEKAVKEGWMDYAVAPHVQELLLRVEPRTPKDANILVSDAFGIAYEIGLRDAYPDPTERMIKKLELAKEIRKILQSYAGSLDVCRVCLRPPSEGMHATWQGACGKCIERAIDSVQITFE